MIRIFRIIFQLDSGPRNTPTRELQICLNFRLLALRQQRPTRGRGGELNLRRSAVERGFNDALLRLTICRRWGTGAFHCGAEAGRHADTACHPGSAAFSP